MAFAFALHAVRVGFRVRRARTVVLASLVTLAAAALAVPAVAGAYVYWANQDSGTIGRANLDGTSPDQSFITGANEPTGVAVSGSYVYWTNIGSGTIGRATLDGTSPDQSFITGANAPGGVAVDGSYVYWTNSGSNAIGRANLDGSGVNQSFIAGADLPAAIAVDGSHVYWTNYSSGTIGRANLDGTSPDQSFITGANKPTGVAVDGSYIYWTNSSGTIGRANLDGTSPDQSFIAGASTLNGVAVDGSSVYWANQGAGGAGSGSIGRADLGGTNPVESFITGTSNPDGVAVNRLGALTTPQNTAAPAIIGTAKVARTLTCIPGSWANSPSEYLYQWSRDGTPIAGATSSSYKVQQIDEGNSLTCTVTAVNAAGSGSPATSTAAKVSVPFVRRCPAASGRLSGSKLGPVKLGDTKAQAEKAFTHSSNRGQRYEQFFCFTPIGIRVGYPSAKALDIIPARQRAKLAGRVIWISTSSAYYAIDGIRPGASTTAAAAKLKLGKVFHIGLNDWYLAPDGAATAILKVRHDIVQEIGLADKQFTRARTEQRTFLTSFS